MWIEIRESLIVFCQKIEDFNAGKRSEKQKNKIIYQRSLAKERRFANDAMRAEEKQKKAFSSELQSVHRQPQSGNAPPLPQQQAPTQNIGVWSGVKLGCGMFIVLPLIVFSIILAVLLVPTCLSVNSKIEKGRQIEKERQIESSGISEENEKILAVADTDGNGTITREEYLAAKEAIKQSNKAAEDSK